VSAYRRACNHAGATRRERSNLPSDLFWTCHAGSRRSASLPRPMSVRARCDMGLPAHTSDPLSRLFACFAGRFLRLSGRLTGPRDQLGGIAQILPLDVFWTCHAGSRRSASYRAQCRVARCDMGPPFLGQSGDTYRITGGLWSKSAPASSCRLR
jgi:hypothetical protein